MSKDANGDIGGDMPNVVAATKYYIAQHTNCWWHHYGSAIRFTRSLALHASMVLGEYKEAMLTGFPTVCIDGAACC